MKDALRSQGHIGITLNVLRYLFKQPHYQAVT